MESQEALKRIRREAGFPYFSTLYDIDMWREDFKTIEEDLEVLEILKHLILGIERTFNQKQCNESGVLGTIIKDYFINNDITGKVEKWLKENKQ